MFSDFKFIAELFKLILLTNLKTKLQQEHYPKPE
jgi:hypothetical protein